jgi:hypothetical protein
VHGFLVKEWALQRTETSLIEQCPVLGFRAAVAVQNLDDVCEEHAERVRQVSRLWRRDSAADGLRPCIWGLVRRTESSDNGRDVPLFDVTTSYNSVDRVAWLGKVTSQRHA